MLQKYREKKTNEKQDFKTVVKEGKQITRFRWIDTTTASTTTIKLSIAQKKEIIEKSR